MPEIDNADGAASATEQAEKRTEETLRFMRSVRRATRRKYTPEEKIRIVLEGFPPGSDRQRPVSQGGDQSCQLLLMDQRVHGGWQSETDRKGNGHCCAEKKWKHGKCRLYYKCRARLR